MNVSNRIYIVEDHLIIQQVLQEHFKRHPDLIVCGVAASAQEALTELPTANATLVIVDVSLPDMSGIELVEQLRQLQPALRCLMLSGHNESHYIHDAIAAGAHGYVLKGNPVSLLDAVQYVTAGKFYLSHELRHLITD